MTTMTNACLTVLSLDEGSLMEPNRTREEVILVRDLRHALDIAAGQFAIFATERDELQAERWARIAFGLVEALRTEDTREDA